MQKTGTQTIIDYIFWNNLESFRDVNTIATELSDHHCVEGTLHIGDNLDVGCGVWGLNNNILLNKDYAFRGKKSNKQFEYFHQSWSRRPHSWIISLSQENFFYYSVSYFSGNTRWQGISIRLLQCHYQAITEARGDKRCFRFSTNKSYQYGSKNRLTSDCESVQASACTNHWKWSICLSSQHKYPCCHQWSKKRCRFSYGQWMCSKHRLFKSFRPCWQGVLISHLTKDEFPWKFSVNASTQKRKPISV